MKGIITVLLIMSLILILAFSVYKHETKRNLFKDLYLDIFK